MKIHKVHLKCLFSNYYWTLNNLKKKSNWTSQSDFYSKMCKLIDYTQVQNTARQTVSPKLILSPVWFSRNSRLCFSWDTSSSQPGHMNLFPKSQKYRSLGKVNWLCRFTLTLSHTPKHTFTHTPNRQKSAYGCSDTNTDHVSTLISV